MAFNDWFSDFTRLIRGKTARADEVNALFDKVETGMDKMPTEVQMNRESRNYALNTGAANEYACSLAHVVTAYGAGQEIVLEIAVADVNTSTTCTLNVSAIANTSVKYPDGSNPAIGDIVGICTFRFNSTTSVWNLTSMSLDLATQAAASAAAAAASESNAGYSETNAAASEAAAASSAAELQGATALTYNATTAFDFLGNQTQTMATVTGDLTTLTTANRADGRSITLILIASGADRTITLNASWRKIGYLPSIIPDGKAFLLNLVCKGNAETDVFVVGGLEA